MFSPNVQSDVRQTVASQQFSSIDDICDELNQEAVKRGFLKEPMEIEEKRFNDFIAAFAYENGMQVRTVQSFAWSFSIDGQKLFDDGVIEFCTTGSKHFTCVKVEDAKITQSHVNPSVIGDRLSDHENLYAHQAWLNKLNDQINDWERDIKNLADSRKEELIIELRALKVLLDSLKVRGKKFSKEAIIVIESRWNSFQDSVNKLKKTMQKSS